MVLSDAYRPHNLEALVAEGLLTREVLSRLDPNRAYGVRWYNQKSRRRGGVTEKARQERIAATVPGIPLELAVFARKAIEVNVPPSSAGRRV